MTSLALVRRVNRPAAALAFGSTVCLVSRDRGTGCNSSAWPYMEPASRMGFQPVQPEELGFAAQCTTTAKSFGKKAASISCRNGTLQRQRVRVPRGYMFMPEEPNMQTLMLEQELDFVVEPGQQQALDFDAYCGFSKARIPKGPMRPSGYRAPSSVLVSQSAVWKWTRAYESPPKGPKQTGWGWFGRPSVPAMQEQRILNQSYGIDAAKYKALQMDLAKIDKDPKSHRTRPVDTRPQGAKTAAKTAASAAKPTATPPLSTPRRPDPAPPGKAPAAPVLTPKAFGKK